MGKPRIPDQFLRLNSGWVNSQISDSRLNSSVYRIRRFAQRLLLKLMFIHQPKRAFSGAASLVVKPLSVNLRQALSVACDFKFGKPMFEFR